MAGIGTEENPLRVAIIGSGPAGFYTVSNFMKQKDLVVRMDMYDRLPTPFGLVRAGVAPDHQKDKSVTRAYDKSAQTPGFRFFGNIEYGKHISLEDLQQYYHQVIFTTGAQVDRNLDIPGEDLAGSHSATEFVAWYNGHPDFADLEFDLSVDSVAIVGMGNVAMDVARILSKTPEELADTDIADYALEALRHSKVRNIYLLGRRGPAQAAFTPPEIKEMGELADCDVCVLPDEAKLDAVSLADMEANPDKNVEKNVGYITEYAARPRSNKKKLLTVRFLVSPTELVGADGRVKAIRLVKNEPYLDDRGTVRPRATDVTEELPVGIVFRSVGYRGVALPGIPFHESWGTIENDRGRVQSSDGEQVTGLYTAGWIKRGPTGVIGTNKTCAQETVQCMVEDASQGKLWSPGGDDIEPLLRKRQPDLISYADWQEIDRVEVTKGEAEGRPRVKFTRVKDMLAVLSR